jgi:hypothetical protein
LKMFENTAHCVSYMRKNRCQTGFGVFLWNGIRLYVAVQSPYIRKGLRKRVILNKRTMKDWKGIERFERADYALFRYTALYPVQNGLTTTMELDRYFRVIGKEESTVSKQDYLRRCRSSTSMYSNR